MKKSLFNLSASMVLASVVLVACAPPANRAPAANQAPPATQAPAATEAPATGPKDIKGAKVCYLLPTLANPFLNNLATTVKKYAAQDGIEVFVYGAEEGGANAAYQQIENCISQGVNAMIVMAPGSIDPLIPAVEEAQKKGIKVIGVPPGDLKPFDAIMHTDQLEDGTKVARMACDFINARYPSAASVDVAVIGNESGEKQMNLRYQGYRTIKDCKKANVVQYVDVATDSLATGQTAVENVLSAHPKTKVFIMQSSAHAQGGAEALKALPNVDLKDYAVFAGDMDPSVIPVVTGCKDPYKGFVAIGGDHLPEDTYALLKKILQGVDYPKITNDELVPTHCDFATLAP
jgi:ABC-type sugar transport system substrate-binding protein